MRVGINQGFQSELVDLSIDELRMTKPISIQFKYGRKYSQILSSVREVGLIEHPVVAFVQKSKEYILLDGHLRIMALKELGADRVTCLVSTDDEGYTYNKYISRLSAIQEHKMIMKALNAGVSEEKLAKALSVDVRSLRNKKVMLDGICPEVVDLLKDKIISGKVFRILKKMKPPRQVRVAMLMNDQNRFSFLYAKSLLEGTPVDQLEESVAKKRISPSALEKRIRLEEENISLGEDVRSLKESYGTDMLNLTLLQAYLKRLLKNEKVANYLEKYHPVIHDKFSEVVQLDFLKISSTG
ncbi:MAG: RepB plasmid partition [Desulfobulbaceae bacterium]|nr:MAG: RepB plasmid partition [Desulfobulbaceae bacterium]